MLIENGVWKGYDRSDLESAVLRISDEVHEVDLRAIHKNMFAYCGGGKQYELFVDPKNPVYYSTGNCMIERETGKIVFGTAESKLPQDGSVRSIGTGAFAWCDFGDKKIDIPGSIENVEKCAFYGAWGIRELRFLTELCFSDFMTRKGLDGKTRELLTVVMLAALGGAEVQVRSHVEGALKTGSTKEEVVCALVHAMPYMGIPRLFNALNCAKELL